MKSLFHTLCVSCPLISTLHLPPMIAIAPKVLSAIPITIPAASAPTAMMLRPAPATMMVSRRLCPAAAVHHIMMILRRY